MNESENRAPLFVFTGIIVLSILFFFLLTSGGDKKTTARGDEAGANQGSASVTPPATGGVMPPDGRLSIPVEMDLDGRKSAPELPIIDGVPLTGIPAPIRAFVSDTLDGTLASTFSAAINAIPLSEQKLLRGMFDSGLWSLAEDEPPRELGQFGDKVRWKLPLRDGSSGQTPSSLYIDLERGRESQSWQLADIRIPPALVQSAVAALTAQGISIDSATIRSEPDALMTAEYFMNAVAASDYDRAIGMADVNKVTREKIAGLFIIVEEGKYHLQEEKPLMATVATSDAAWIIGRIKSNAGMPASDFGVELARDSTSDWKVTGLHFSKLLATFTSSSSPKAIPYTPIVENPSGGESLVLYFGYDEDMLHLRAQRQLLIVSALLKDDTSKRLRITGHADALGTEDYNLALSGRRAFSVRDHLIELGVPATQIVTEGFGESSPLAANVRDDGSDNPEGRSRNRRTEIYLDF